MTVKELKEKALSILKDNINWHYSFYCVRPRNIKDIENSRNELCAVYETLRDLGLVTSEEYRAMKAEVRERLGVA